MATKDQAPHLTAAILNTILAKTVANATPADLLNVLDALKRISKMNPNASTTSQLP